MGTEPSASEAAVEYFLQCVDGNPDLQKAMAAMKSLILFIQQSKAATIMELRKDLASVVESLVAAAPCSLQVSAGLEMFTRFITRTASEFVSVDFDECRNMLVDRGKQYIDKAVRSKEKIVALGDRFIRDGATVLTNSFSKVVTKLLLNVAKNNKRVRVLVTESRPDCSGYKTASLLKAAGMMVSVVSDSAVAYLIEKVDLVLVGAEGVCESGGIINKIGTFHMAITAKQFNKPFYVIAESFKFIRMYPLSQADLSINAKNINLPFPDAKEQLAANSCTSDSNIDTKQTAGSRSLDFINPLVDYTPPTYVALLFTDLGLLTPSAVGDNLLQLYY